MTRRGGRLEALSTAAHQADRRDFLARQTKKKKAAGRGRQPKRRKAAPGATTKRSQASPRADREPRAARLVVGLGASAGGLDAFKHFFAHMPPNSGMAFVLVQHLDPDHKSLLVELLAKQTRMPVVQAEDGMAVVPDHVFVIPPNAVLRIKGRVLQVETPAPPREHRKPIDVFFASSLRRIRGTTPSASFCRAAAATAPWASGSSRSMAASRSPRPDSTRPRFSACPAAPPRPASSTR